MSVSWPTQYDRNYLPAVDDPYWDRRAETMDPEEREQTLILPKIRAQMAYAYAQSPFYRKKWDAAGVRPEDIRSLADFEQVPFVTKDEIRADQIEHPPFGSYACKKPNEAARVHGTSGTTGRPTAFGISRDDLERVAWAQARGCWSFGLRPDDMVFIGSFFSLYWGSWGALLGTERVGATAFPFGAGVPGMTERGIEWIQQMRPTAFYGTPSYALYIAEVARNMGVDPAKDFNFRVLFFSGEPGAGIPSTKKLIEDAYGAMCIDTGSTAEMTPWMTNCECVERRGMHLHQDIVYTEVVDRETKRRLPYGGEGVTVYTHLERTSQPMIRFWAGDITTWTDEPCPCGRTLPRLPKGIYGRADDMFTIRGENVYPNAIEDIIRAHPDSGEEFRIIITREKTMDELIVQVETRKDLDAASQAPYKDALETELKKVLGVRASVQLTEPGTLERTQFKARRIVDQRHLYDELVKK